MISQFKSLDPLRYQWNQSPEASRLWRRGALAGENLWIQRPREVRQLFLGANVCFLSPFCKEEVREGAFNAWAQLLASNSHVMVAPSSQPTQDKSRAPSKRFLEFRVADAEDDVCCHDASLTKLKALAMKTFSYETASSVPLGFDKMRLELMERIRGQDELVDVLLHEVVSQADQACPQIEIVLWADHLITDGIGIRILLGKYLNLISEELAVIAGSARSKPPVELSLSRQSLAEPWFDSMNCNQVISGTEYEAAVEAQEKFLLSDTVNNWGLPVASSESTKHDASPKTAYYSITLSEQQSIRLLTTVKLRLGPKATITHLAHAAAVLALLQSQPLPLTDNPSDQEKNTLTALFSPCWMNGRPYLSKHETLSNPELSYIPVCQAMGQITFHDLPSLQVSPNATRDDILKVLLECSEQAMRGYSEIKARKSILSESLPLMDLLGDMMASHSQIDEKASAAGKSVTSALLIDGASRSQTGQNAPIAAKRATPFLLSDGIGERYIDREYGDNFGRQFFEVRDLKFVANAEGPNLIVRLSTWRDRLSVSGEWKEGDYTREMIESYLNDVTNVMLTITDPEIII